MSKGFTDWTDLGIFPLQDVEEGVPIGMRMALVGGRVAKRPDAGANGGAAVTEYAREDDMGTLGDIHPWLFWQTADREKRPMGSWSMAWGGVVMDLASQRYGGAASVQPLTKDGNRMIADVRYRRLIPAWQGALPWQPEGMMAMIMPSTSETEPDSMMFSADRRLVAAGAGGPGEAGTTIVDMQPDGVLCMGGSPSPGMGGRHARLQGLVRVIALDGSSVPALSTSPLNGIALNYGASQQDGIMGYGMIYGRAVSGGRGPTTGASGGTRSTGGPPPSGGGNGGFASGSNGDSIGSVGEFAPQTHGNMAVGLMSQDASGPIVIGCQKHQLGVDRDGHNITSAHISSQAYFFDNSSYDGPLLFEGEFPDDVKESSIATHVHMSWDKSEKHRFIGGSRSGKWRWWTTVPYVNPFGGPHPSTPGTPYSPTTPSSPSTPGTPAMPGTPPPPGQPGVPGAPGSPSTPGGGGGVPGAPGSPSTPGSPTAPPGPTALPGRPVTAPSTHPLFGLPISGTGWDWKNPEPAPPPPQPETEPASPVTPPWGPALPPTPAYLLDLENPAGIISKVGGSARGRDVGAYSILHPFNNAFASISMRPQLWIKGAPNFEHNPDLGATAYIEEEKARPSTLTIRAWGAQDVNGEWDYLETPGVSRARGGIVNGGILISPAEFEMEDYLGINSQEDTDSPTATTYVTFAPKVAAAFGKPTTVGVLSTGAKILHQDTSTGELVVSGATDSLGATTDILKMSVNADGFGYAEMQGTGAIKIPRGTTAERPSVAAAGMFRLNSSNGLLEYYDSSWLPAGTGYVPLSATATVSDMQTGTSTTVGGTSPFLSRAGWLIKEAAAPSVAPPSSGMIHYDSTTGDIHFADGTATVNDWRLMFMADKGSRDFRLDDDEKLLLGSSDELRIYYDSANALTRLETAGVGGLMVQSDLVRLTGTNPLDFMLVGVANGATTLFYNGFTKFSTTLTGANVTGDLTISGTVDGRDVATDGSKLDGIESGATADQLATDINLARVAGSTYSTLQDMQNQFHSAGLGSDGGITDDADGTISVAGGTCFIRTTNSAVGQLVFTDFAAEAGVPVALTDLTMNYVYVEYNAGAPQVIATTTKRTDLHTNVFLGSVFRSGTELHITATTKVIVGDHALQMVERMKQTAPFARVSGGVVSAVGTRGLAVSAGVFWEGLNRFTTAAFDTTVASTFERYWSDGAGGWTETLGLTQIDNLLYDDGSGTLATLSNNKFGVRWVYLAQDSQVYIVMGTTNGQLANAEDEGVPAALPPHFAEDHVRLVGKIIIAKSDTVFTSIESSFTSTFTAGIAPEFPVTSVNAQTGVVVLDADDIANGTGSFFMTLAHKQMADNIDVIANQRIVGNVSGFGGAPAALTAAQVQTMIGYDPKLQPRLFGVLQTEGTGTPTLEANGYNLASVSRTGTGLYTFTFSGGLGLTANAYTAVLGSGISTSAQFFVAKILTRTAAVVTIEVRNAATLALADGGDWPLTIHANI